MSGNVVEVWGGRLGDWDPVGLSADHGGNNAVWNLIHKESYTKFKNAHSGLMLNVSGGKYEDMIQYHEDFTAAERYVIEKYDGNDYLARIRYGKSGRYLDVPAEGVFIDGMQLQLWSLYPDHQNQIFRVHPLDNGYVQIFSVLTNKIIEVRCSSHEPCAKVAQWRTHNLPCGQWKIRENKDGTVSLRNKESGLYMNVASGVGGQGNPIWQYEDDQTEALSWCIERLDFLPRLEEPSKSNPLYHGNGNPFVKNGWRMPNCTTYAWGRAWEILGREPDGLSQSSAMYWWAENQRTHKFEYGSIPRVGAIAVWGWNGAPDDPSRYGHVAVVEEILKDGKIKISESHFETLYFQTAIKDAENPYCSANTVFQGYIYIK